MAYNSSHTGTEVDDAIDKTQLMPELKGEKTAYANLPGSPTTGDVYLVTTATTGYSAGFYRYSGSAWVFMGSAVTTVNTQTGAVVLDADDIDDTATTHKFTSSGEITKLSNIEENADVTNTTNVTSAGALMDSELTSIADVKALDQSVVSGAAPTFTGTNFSGTAASLTVGATTGVEAGADVTDTANVTAAGALMDSEVTNLAQVKAFSSADYATAAQGAKADSALQSESDTLDSVTGRGATTTNGVTVGSITINGEIVEDVYINSSVTGSLTLDPANGTIQVLTLTGSVTSVTDSLANGEAITIVFSTGGSAYAISGWPTTKWVGGSAPTIDTTNNSIIVLWKANSVLYGMESGVAS